MIDRGDALEIARDLFAIGKYANSVDKSDYQLVEYLEAPISNDELWSDKSRLLKMLSKWKKDGEGRWMRYRFMESGNEYKLMVKWDQDYRVWTTLHGKKTFKSRLAAMNAEDTYGRRKGFILMETI